MRARKPGGPVDLHGKTRHEAIETVAEALDSSVRSKLLLITGRGRHSPGGRPVIKPLVATYLNRNGYWAHWHEGKASGAVTVELSTSTEDW